MTSNDLTFGIEIETVISDEARAENRLYIGSYHHGRQVPYLPDGWRCERDGSLVGERGDWSAEIVSPVLQGVDGLNEAIEAVKTLREKGHRVNKTCGVHVHVGFGDHTREELDRMFCNVAHLQNALYASTGTKSRERGHYCKPIRVYGDAAEAFSRAKNDRYHVLNITNLKMLSESSLPRKNTVEFRAFSGSLNPVKIAAWAQIALGIVEKSFEMKRTPNWNPGAPKGGMARKSGDGAGEIERLIHALQWREDVRVRSGRPAYGWLGSDKITEEQVRVELRRLGAKYDACV